jgi:hypothetical protein
MIYLTMRSAVQKYAFRVEQRALEGVMPQKMRQDELKDDIERVAARYRENVRSIIGTARSRGIPVVLIKQPVTARAPGYENLSYEAENAAVRRRFERGERLSYIDVWMIKQHRLMDELMKIVREENLPLVDNVRITDADRRRLASWVHLTGEGNARLAEALASAIKPYVLERDPRSSADGTGNH